MTHDPQAFHDFEQRGWQKAAGWYHSSFGQITSQSIEPLLDAAGVGKGVQMLDVACGPGYAAAAAVERGAAAVGVDFSSAMVAEAQRLFPGLNFREGDAEDLPFPDRSFEAVVLSFGMLHLARPERALSEAYRVLRSGGRVAFTVWDTPDKAVAFGIVLSAIQNHGDMNVPLPPGPPFFRFSDPAESETTLRSAGFTDIKVVHVPQAWRLESPDFVFDAMLSAAVRTGALLRGQPPQARNAIRREIRQAVEKFRKGDGFELPMPAVLSSGRKPAEFSATD